MFENLIVALSNLTCIYPIYLSWIKHDMITMYGIIFVSSASFLSHLVENHKHGMTGIGLSPTISYLLNRVDVFGCIIVIIRFLQLYYNKYGLSIDIILNNKIFFANICYPFLFNLISEYDKYNPVLKPIYIVTHSIWHITIFISMFRFLKYIIY